MREGRDEGVTVPQFGGNKTPRARVGRRSESMEDKKGNEDRMVDDDDGRETRSGTVRGVTAR